jgi:hypothetical protein
MQFKQYDVVRIVELLSPVKEVKSEFNVRAPEPGDIATIVEIYTNPYLGYELECCDSAGNTQWLVTFNPSDINIELL